MSSYAMRPIKACDLKLKTVFILAELSHLEKDKNNPGIYLEFAV